MTYVAAIALVPILPLLIDVASFMRAVRRQQARTDVTAIEKLMQTKHGPLGKPPLGPRQGETMLIDAPPQRGAFIGDDKAVRVEGALPWRSPLFRRPSIIRTTATVALLPTAAGGEVVARVE